MSFTNNFVENNRNINFGGEIFWDINSESKLDVSLNPDFGQVESDDLIVNFSAIETFYEDKRPFFTENQTLFEITGWNLYFINTRRIGGIPDKCSPTNETLKGQCKNSLIDSSDIDLALRYSQKSQKMNLVSFLLLKRIAFIHLGEIILQVVTEEIFLKPTVKLVIWLLQWTDHL